MNNETKQQPDYILFKCMACGQKIVADYNNADGWVCPLCRGMLRPTDKAYKVKHSVKEW